MAITRSTSTGWLQDLDAANVSRPTSAGWVEATAVAGGGAVALDAAALAAATAVANLSHTVPIAGAGITVATATGAMSISIPLAGTGQGTASATGDLSLASAAAVDLAATATATANAQGGLSLSIPLSGNAIAQALAQAGITHGVPLAGDAATTHVIYTARPDGDISNVGVVITGAATIYEALNEVTPNDSTYITWDTGDVAKVSLGTIPDPGINTGHKFRIRLWTTNGWAGFQLAHNGAEVLGKFYTGNAPLTPTTLEFELTPAQADLITDYSALEVNMVGLIGTTSYSWAEFSVEVPGAEATGNLAHGVPLSAVADIQYVLPNADLALGTWTPTAATAWESLADGVTDNGHYVTSSMVDEALVVQLPPVAAPPSTSTVRIACSVSCPTLDGLVAFQLYCGETSIRSTVASVLSATATEKSVVLTAANIAAITDWSALTLRLYGVGTIVSVHKLHLQIESGAVSTAIAGGNLSLNVSLSGDAAADATASGLVDMLGSANLSGAPSGVTTASGDLSLNVSLFGTAVAQAAASSGITLEHNLSGAALSVASASGAVSHSVPLSGMAVTNSNATGEMSIAVKMSGAALSAAIASASLSQSVMLDGDTTANPTASAVITLEISLAGSATAIAAASGMLTQVIGGLVAALTDVIMVWYENRTIDLPGENRTIKV